MACLLYIHEKELWSSLPHLISSVNLLVFACRSPSLCDIGHKSLLAKSKSSRMFSAVQRIPFFSLLTVCCDKILDINHRRWRNSNLLVLCFHRSRQSMHISQLLIFVCCMIQSSPFESIRAQSGR
ncbi:unnamed protein product [Heterobilharzia americana]|nr:unnamed protein product [Heterobilharzia americana]